MSPTALVQEAGGGLDIGGIDLFGLGLVAVFVVLGALRGLWWQVIRLAGLVAAVAVARAFAPALGDWAEVQWPEVSTRLSHGASWLVLFLAALTAATLLGVLGQRLLEAMQLGWANRLGGAAVGAVTGVGLHVAITLGLCQLAPESFVTGSITGTWSGRAVEQVSARWQAAVGDTAGTELQRLLVDPGTRTGVVR
jgi:hypothetical protein